MCEFANKVVVVTGASSGIGKATAEAFAKHGCLLVITGRNVENLGKVAETCKRNGAKDVLQILADFDKLSEVDEIVEQTVNKFNRIDILVNNAGVAKSGRLESAEMDDFDWMFKINVKAMLRLTQKFMPHLVESKGCVVNLASICSQCAILNLLVYNMTQAAIDQFTKTIALEYAPKGVRVNAVNPSAVPTNIFRDSGYTSQKIEKYYLDSAAGHPIGRVGTTEDVAKAILFLASEDSAWTTGQCLVLDGGRSLTVNQGP